MAGELGGLAIVITKAEDDGVDAVFKALGELGILYRNRDRMSWTFEKKDVGGETLERLIKEHLGRR